VRVDGKQMTHEKRGKLSQNRRTSSWRLRLVVALALAGRVGAVDPETTLRQLNHTAWSVKDGAPSGIMAMAQTTDGYLWLGTMSGLVRFDGVRFESFSALSGEKLVSNAVTALIATGDGGLWIGYQFGGASFWKDGVLRNYSEADGFPSTLVDQFAIQRDGTVWAATYRGPAYFDGKKWRIAGNDWNFDGDVLRSILVAGDGTLWAIAPEKAFFLPLGSRTFTGVDLPHLSSNYFSLVEHPDGSVWVMERTTNDQGWAIQLAPPHGTLRSVLRPTSGYMFDTNGDLWARAAGGASGRFHFPSHSLQKRIGYYTLPRQVLGKQDGMTGDSEMFLEDRQGNIWVATTGGLDRFRDARVLAEPLPLQNRPTPSIVGEPDGSLLVGETHGGRSTRILRYGRDGIHSSSGPASGVSCLYRDSSGAIWVGGTASIGRIVHDHVVNLKLPASVNPHDEIQAITMDRSGDLWLSIVREGVFKWKPGNADWRTPAELPKLVAVTEFTDRRGRIWFGYTNSRIAVIEGSRVHTFAAKDGLMIGNATAIAENEDAVWVGGEHGLEYFRDDGFKSVRVFGDAELQNISGLAFAQNGDMWLNQASGAVRIPAAEIKQETSVPLHEVHVELFDYRDGLTGYPTPLRPLPSVVETSDGRLWFSTSAGLFQIDPRRISRPAPRPQTVFEAVKAMGRTYRDLSGLTLPVNSSNLTIEYTALGVSAPERVVFRYQLGGIDKDWQEVGTRRDVFFARLRPGHYAFRVSASTGDGIWTDASTPLRFYLPPTFMQSAWFTGLCAAAGVGMIVLLLLLRSRQITARVHAFYSERLAERARVARELHDTVLQGSVGISLQMRAAVGQVSDKSPAKPALERIIGSMRQLIEDERNALEGLRSTNLDSISLRRSLDLVAESEQRNGIPRYHSSEKGAEVELHPSIRNEAYSVGREALLNAFRHANASHIAMRIEYQQSALRMVVRDDGRGIDPNILRHGRSGHWGLPGMRERVERIGGELDLVSDARTGTQVDLRIPAHIAYRGDIPGKFARLTRWISAPRS